MAVVKEKGRDSWQFFNRCLQDQARQRFEIVKGLYNAIERGEFSARFQPIVIAESGRIVGAELLLRRYPPQGKISPSVRSRTIPWQLLKLRCAWLYFEKFQRPRNDPRHQESSARSTPFGVGGCRQSTGHTANGNRKSFAVCGAVATRRGNDEVFQTVQVACRDRAAAVSSRATCLPRFRSRYRPRCDRSTTGDNRL